MCLDSVGRVPFHPNMKKDQFKQQQKSHQKRANPPKGNGSGRKPKLSKMEEQNVTNNNNQDTVHHHHSMGLENRGLRSPVKSQAQEPVDSRVKASSPIGIKTPASSPSKKTPSPITIPYRSPSKSPTLGPAYAGAKFSDPPSPKVLPKPPTHWFNGGKAGTCSEMSSVLKLMLNVQA